MENDTKYRLKTAAELAQILADTDNVFVIGCNKCFKEFHTAAETDVEAFTKLLREQGKTVTGTEKLDFVCNKIQTAKALENLIPEMAARIQYLSPEALNTYYLILEYAEQPGFVG